jgi:ATP-binding cassette subfamily B protein
MNKIAPIKQPEGDACGPACIQVISNYFGIPLSFHEVIKVSEYDREAGMSNSQLVGALIKLGYKVEATANASWEMLQKENTKDKVTVVSYMLHGYIGHLAIVDEVTDENVKVLDPETGTFTTTEKAIFLRLWFDYDELDYPQKNTDIQLRWMAVVSK